MSNEEEWLVSDKTCKGCKYYGYLSHTGRGTRCCDYTYYTGRIREDMPRDCTVKKRGKSPALYRGTTGIIERKKVKRDG